MKRCLACVVLIAACGGDDGGGSGQPLVLDAAGAKLAAVHDGERWSTIALDAEGTATLDIDRPMLIATVCDDPGFMNYYATAVGPGTESLDMYCATTTVLRTVTIDAASSTTRVAIGFGRTFAGRDTIVVKDGTYDVIAVDVALTPPRVEIRRDVAVHGDMTLAFDLAASGTPMTKVDVGVTGAGSGEVPSRFTSVVIGPTATPTLLAWPATEDVWVVPQAMRVANDRHRVGASTDVDAAGSSSRHASTEIGSATAYTLALPAYLATATVTLGAAPSVAWTGADPAFDDFYFGINSPDFARLWDVHVAPSWALAGGGDPHTLVLPDPRGIPGWRSAWDLPAVTTGFEWTLSAGHDTEAAGRIEARRTGTL